MGHGEEVVVVVGKEGQFRPGGGPDIGGIGILYHFFSCFMVGQSMLTAII